MRLWSRVRSWVRATLGRSRMESEMDAELRFHIEAFAEDLVRNGVPRQEAMRRARIEFGGIERAKEECRDARGTNFVESLIQDLRYGLRMLRRFPGFTLVAAFSVALGIGANTAVFSVVSTVLLSPLPYADADRLVLVKYRTIQPRSGPFELTPASYLELRRANKSFEGIADFTASDFNSSGGVDQPERLSGQMVSPSFFSVLKVSPLIGRGFTDDDEKDGAPRVAILSYGLWQRHYGGQANVIGETLTLDDEHYEVVGVAPRGFDFPRKGTDIWVPKIFAASEVHDRNSYYLNVIARLKTGVSLDHAQSELNVFAHNWAESYPENRSLALTLMPLRDTVVQGFQQALVVLQAAVAFVLLIACVNVANLLLARSAVREKEIASRAALGASARRLIRQLLTESVILALVGGTLGLLLATLGIRILKLMNPGTIPRLDEVTIDSPVLAFTFGISCLAGFAFGLAPALGLARLDVQRTLKEGGPGSGAAQRLRGVLVVAEIALSLVLMVGAGLLIRSFLRLQNVSLGFTPEHLLTLQMRLPKDEAQDSTRVANLFREVIERVQAVHGVQVVGVATALPVMELGIRSSLTIEGRTEPSPGQPPRLANNRVVSPGYFRALGIPLIEGRLPSTQDSTQVLPVAVINRAMAKRYWSDENPVGKRFRLQASGTPPPWLTVVGVVGDIHQGGLDTAPVPEFYTPFTQDYPPFAVPLVLFVRTDGNPWRLISEVREQIGAVEKNLPVFAIQTMEDVLAQWLAPRRFNLLLMSVFAGVALALAAVGIYGVVSYSVSQRTRELGVRVALGAQPRDLLALVIRQGLVLAVTGVVMGLVVSFGLTRWLATLLFGISATDPITLASVASLFMLVALFACYLPARRAMKVDPMVALRYE